MPAAGQLATAARHLHPQRHIIMMKSLSLMLDLHATD